jgi:Holliday junction resolvasome RuvABC endonuclease subunit
MKTVLALDVAYAHMGWAVIEPYQNKSVVERVGCIDNKSITKKKKVLYTADYELQRVTRLYKELKKVYVTSRPSCVIAEIPASGGRSQQSAAAMAMGKTIVACLVAEYEVPAQWTSPDDGKMALCNSLQATKLQMQAAAMEQFPELRKMVPKSKRKSKSGYEGWFEHAADAIAAFVAARDGNLVRFLAAANSESNSESSKDESLLF